MVCKVELIPISEGNRITVKENEKILVGRGSSLGCNDKKISRQHAELLLKKDETLWIKPTHVNPIFYRPLNGKTTHLTKDIEQKLKDGDQIGLLPTSFFFRVSFSTDLNNNKDELSSERADNHADVKPKSSIQDASTSTASSVKDQNKSEKTNSDQQSRTLPVWMSATTPTSSDPQNSSSSVKRKLSTDGDKSKNVNESSDTTEATVPSKSTVAKTVDSDSEETFDSVLPKKVKLNNKPRPACQYGASCYRKNQAHRTEQSHPGDSDYEDEKKPKDNNKDDSDADKLPCPYGKTCYRQNPQHKRDYKH